MASEDPRRVERGASELTERFKNCIANELRSLTVHNSQEFYHSVHELWMFAYGLLENRPGTAQLNPGKWKINQSFLLLVLNEFGGKKMRDLMIFYPTPQRYEAARAFCYATTTFSVFSHLGTQLNSLEENRPAVDKPAVDQQAALPLMSVSLSGLQRSLLPRADFEGKGVVYDSGGSDDTLSGLTEERGTMSSVAIDTKHSQHMGAAGSSPAVGRSFNTSADYKKVIFIQDFAFHLFFMATRMPYRVLGSQCNELNREYLAGGIVGLCNAAAQYIERAAVGLQLWTDSAGTQTSPSKLQQCYNGIKTMVENSLKEVESTSWAPPGWNQKYHLIRQQVDHLSRDVRERISNFGPCVIFVFDLHRILALLNADCSILFQKSGKQQYTIAPQFVRNEARDFVSMTRSIPDMFTTVYVDAVQVARYHCSRICRGVLRESHEFGVQLTFIRFLMDNMKPNVDVSDASCIHFVALKDLQTAVSSEKLTQFFEAGLHSIEDLHVENSHPESSYTQADLETGDEELQMAIQLSKQEVEAKQMKGPVAAGEFDDLDLAVAKFLSLEESKQQSQVKSPTTGLPCISGPSGHGNEAIGSLLVPGTFGDIAKREVQTDGLRVEIQQQEQFSELQCSAISDEFRTLVDSRHGHLYHHLSVDESIVNASFLRVDIVGRDKVGKTSLAKSLMGEKFDAEQSSTKGLESLQIEVLEMADWQRCEGSFDSLGDHVVAASVAQKLKEVQTSSSLQIQTFDSAVGMSDDYCQFSVPSAIRSYESLARSSSCGVTINATNAADISTIRFSLDSHGFQEIRPRSHSDIPEVMKQLIGRYYSGDSPLDVNPDRLYLAVFDYGGHTVYSPSNVPFLSKNGLKLLVFSLCEALSDPCLASVFKFSDSDQSCPWGTIDLTNWEVIEQWLSYIYLTAPEKRRSISKPRERCVPCISLVATHKDKAAKSHGKKLNSWLKKQSDYIAQKLGGKKILEHMLPGHGDYRFVCVDNTKSSEKNRDRRDEGVLWLKELIQTVAKQLSEPVPVRWLMIGKTVKHLRDSGVLVTPQEDLRSLTASLNLIKDDKEFTEALEFLGDRGLLVSQCLQWCGKRQEVVITHLQWLAGSFSRILTVHSGNTMDRNCLCDLGTLVTKGILSQRLTDHLLDCDKEHKGIVLESMMAFDLICIHTPASRQHASQYGFPCLPHLDTDDSSDEGWTEPETDIQPHDVETSVYIVPSMLKPKPQRALPLTPHYLGEKVTSLWFSLPEGCFPEQAIHRLLTHLIKAYPYLPQIFYHEGLFNVRPGHRLHLLVEDQYLRLIMYITDSCFSSESQQHCNRARQSIQEKFVESLKRDMPRIGDLRKGIRVKLGHQSDEVTFAVVKRKSGAHYLSTATMPELDFATCAPLLYLWFKDMKKPNKDEPAKTRTREMSRPPIRPDSSIRILLDEGPGADALNDVASSLDEERETGDDWRALYQCLLGSEASDRGCFPNLSGSPTVATLRLWLERNESEATIHNLVCGLSFIQRNDVANHLQWNADHHQCTVGAISSVVTSPLVVNHFNYYS